MFCTGLLFMANNYIDVTEKWLKEAKPKKGKIKFLNYAITSKNMKYDFSNSILGFNVDDDLEIGTWFKNNIWGNCRFQPTVDYPQGIRVPDLRVFNCPFIDGRTIEIKTINSKRKDGITRRLKEAIKQSQNVLVDVSNYRFDLKIIKQEISKYYEKHNSIKTIIVKKHNNLLFVWQRI